MSTGKSPFRNLIVAIALTLAIWLPVQPALAAVAVGQTASADTRVDGIQVPSGTTLISPAVVEAGASGAVIHLRHGEVIAMAPRTTAVVASADNGIRLANEVVGSVDRKIPTLRCPVGSEALGDHGVADLPRDDEIPVRVHRDRREILSAGGKGIDRDLAADR